MDSYAYFNGQLLTDLFFPELIREPVVDPACAPAAAQLRLTRGAPEVTYGEAVHHWRSGDDLELSCFGAGEWFRLELPGEIVTHIDTRNRHIYYEAAAGVEAHTLRHFLIDQALPRLLGHLGAMIVHGACVTDGSRSLVFLGETGAGKSTLCGSFAADGWTVLSDDCLLLEPENPPRVHGAYGGIRLWPDSLEHLGLEKQAMGLMTGGSDKTRVRLAAPGLSGGYPLNMAVVLKASESLGLGRLTASQAVMALVAGSFNLDPGDSLLSRNKLRRYAELIENGLTIHSCHYPRDFRALDRIKALLIEALPEQPVS